MYTSMIIDTTVDIYADPISTFDHGPKYIECEVQERKNEFVLYRICVGNRREWMRRHGWWERGLRGKGFLVGRSE